MADLLAASEADLNAIVAEYLQFAHYPAALRAFEAECKSKGKALSNATGRSLGDARDAVKKAHVQGELMAAFDDGDHHGFFGLWDRNLPAALRKKDLTCQKLEFSANIYFAVYPLLHSRFQSKKRVTAEQSMKRFKEYLESRGADLCKTTEFLAFYALPFIPDPRAHPSFKGLFSDSWVPELKARLEGFLAASLKTTSQPRLLLMHHASRSKATDELRGSVSVAASATALPAGPAAASAELARLLQQQVADGEQREILLIERHNRMQAEYHNLVGIAAELVEALESTLRGKSLTPEYMTNLFGRLTASSNLPNESISIPVRPSSAIRDRPITPRVTASTTSLQHAVMHHSSRAGTAALPSPSELPSHLSPIDYARVKAQMQTAEDRPKALLLQALRWRLTRGDGPQRRAVLSSYIKNDLLGCAGPPQLSLYALLGSSAAVVRENVARLMNAVASFCAGRGYILRSPHALETLRAALVAEHSDSVVRQNVLGAMQKLSLRRAAQSAMIREGVIGWLVTTLGDLEGLSEYSVEYAAALLMNLSLRTLGRRRCAADAGAMLRLLSELLEHENTQVRTYVNGTLYSLLSSPAAREEARAMGMDEMLRTLMEVSDENMARQLQYILDQLNSDADEGDEGSSDHGDDDVEDDDDADDVFLGLDENESIGANPSELSGERLLAAEFATTASEARDDPSRTTVKKKKTAIPGHLGIPDHPLSRPTTPSVRPQTAEAERPATSGGRTPQRSASRVAQSVASSIAGIRESIAVDASVDKRPASGAASVRAPSTEPIATPKPPPPALDLSGTHDYETVFSTRSRLARTPLTGQARPPLQHAVDDDDGPQPRPVVRAPAKGTAASSNTPAKKAPARGAAQNGSATAATGPKAQKSVRMSVQ